MTIPARLLVITAIVACLGSLGCDAFAPDPGSGSVAERGYREFQPAIEALEAYRQREGSYPDSLEILVQAGDLAELPEAPQPDHIARYRLGPDGYELLFTYTGPGVNRCTHRPASGWSCEGYH